ncbi:hypothetical protein VTN77DRAFT_2147 [Rasamsonia byssochlamydoides]|uniref:uncharacterized protein n=1 Tax=Rasamsonia byssochlamydoides TaxID=89139 RepID=UPI003741F0CF
MANTEPVHFFDITSKLPGPLKSWSPNTLKTRLVLNYKGIPYTQSFISYPDIASLLKSLNVPPLAEAVMPYTLPAIVHKASVTANPNGAMNDSLPIALHLDKTFPAPQYPPLFPSGDASYALALAVAKIISNVVGKGIPILMPKVADILDERGSKYFHETRSKIFGKPLAELLPQSEEAAESVWNDMKKELNVLADMLKGKPGKEGPFFEGTKPGYADLQLVAYLAWFERTDKGLWEKVMDLDDAFKRLYEASLPWVNGQGEEKEWPVASL